MNEVIAEINKFVVICVHFLRNVLFLLHKYSHSLHRFCSAERLFTLLVLVQFYVIDDYWCQ